MSGVDEPLLPPGTFLRVRREVLVDNPWHRYCLDSYAQSDGSPGRYYYVDMPGSCGIIPVFSDGSTVLLRSYRYLLETWIWEFPIGGMAVGESALQVAQKELEEEAGLQAARWTSLGSFAPYKGVSNERCHYFLAEDLTETAQHLEPSELASVHRLPWAQARERLLDQELPDGQSLSGLLLLERHWSRREH